MSQPLTAINDFVIKFANVNGSGSASANQLFAKAILRMGVPAAPRNIFPSNIQGLPTWYEVRISEAGHLGCRGGVDLLVAMNPQTFTEDVAEIEPGGYLFYDNSKPVPAAQSRSDITVLGLPLTQICNDAYSDPRQRQLFKNIIYLGALSALLEIPPDIIEHLLGEQYRSKEQLIAPNLQAFHMGRAEAAARLPCPLGLRLRKSDKVGDRISVEGNAACALGAVYGGATVAAWYPITPSTSLAEAFERYCKRFRVDPETKKNRFAIVQAEDELASIGMVLGATWNGARAFTTTSGPGISLMQEFLGLAYFAEIPAVIFDVQRGGPSTGMPTRTQQSDLLSAAYASHGDTKHILLLPQDPHECFIFSALSFDLADRLQTPVFVMLDLEIGMNERLCAPFTWDDKQSYDRGKVMDFDMLEGGADFQRYGDVDGDGIPYRTYPGTHPTRGAYFTRGSSKDHRARYTEKGDAYAANMERLRKKFLGAVEFLPRPEIRKAPQPATAGIIYFGSSSAPMDETAALLANEGIALDTLRIRSFPFHSEIADFIADHETIFVVEQNRDAQMRSLLTIELGIDPNRLQSVLHFAGTPLTARFITGSIRAALAPQHLGKAAE